MGDNPFSKGVYGKGSAGPYSVEEWRDDNNGWDTYYGNYPPLSPGFLLEEGPKGYITPKRTAAVKPAASLTASLETRNQFTHLVEEDENEDIPLNAVQVENAAEPYSAQGTRGQGALPKGGITGDTTNM